MKADTARLRKIAEGWGDIGEETVEDARHMYEAADEIDRLRKGGGVAERLTQCRKRATKILAATMMGGRSTLGDTIATAIESLAHALLAAERSPADAKEDV